MSNCTGVTNNKCTTGVTYYGYVYVLTSISVLGVTFNILNLCVFFRKSFRAKIASTTLTYLTGLAVADGVASLTVIPLGLFRCVTQTGSELQMIWRIYEMFVFVPLVNSFIATSVWITFTVSAERCLFVTQHTGILSRQIGFLTLHPKRVVTGIYISSFIFNLPFWFYYDVDVTLATGVSTQSDFGNSVYFDVWSWIRLAVAKILPIMGVVAFNAILIHVTWKNNQKLKSHNAASALSQKRQKSQDKMTFLLISISGVFVATNVLEPLSIPSIYQDLFGTCSVYTDAYNVFLMVINTAESVSFASNFLSYCFFNTHFVKALKEMCSCCEIRCLKIRRNSINSWPGHSS